MTWYPVKTKKQAVTGSYGAWLAPDGELIPVGYQEHFEVAGKILGEKFMSMKAEETLLNAGYVAITFMGGLAVKHRKGLTDIQVKKILNLQKSEGATHVRVDSGLEHHFSKDPMELFSILTASKVTKKDMNYRVLKKAAGVYGHWISPSGQIIEVTEYQGHHKVAEQILKDLDIVSASKWGFKGELLEQGWMKTAYEASEMQINSETQPTEAQAQMIQKLAQMAPKRINMFMVELPTKSRYIMRDQIGQLAKFIINPERRILAQKQRKMIKTALVDLSEFEKFIKDPDSVQVNPNNQLGNYSNLYDVQRYVMDSYSTKTAISKTKRKITVSILTTHAFLGSVAFNKYWTFEFKEWKKAIDLYKHINQVTQEMIEKFVDEEITTTVFWPMLKYKLDQLQPERNAATNIPWVNYSRYYDYQVEPDWRQNIYGTRYPDYSEPSYDQEIKRKNVFFD